MGEANKPIEWENVEITLFGQKINGVVTTKYDGDKTLSFSFKPPVPLKEINIPLAFNLEDLPPIEYSKQKRIPRKLKKKFKKGYIQATITKIKSPSM